MAKQQETQWQRWKRIAKAADVNWRTVRAYYLGKPLRTSTENRIRCAAIADDMAKEKKAKGER